MFSLFDQKITKKEEHRLKIHSYKSVDKSILSAYIFKKYTSMVLNHTPKIISPNALTLFGFFIMLINFFTVVCVDQDLKSKTEWLALLSGLSLFFYFTMDNLDGAQARRLKEISPMGQLFDHGVDSCAVFFCMITLMSSMRLGFTYTSIMVMLSVMYGFYFSGLEEKFTDVFEFGLISGPTEGIMLMVVLHFLSAFYDRTFKATVDNFIHYPPLTRAVTFVYVSPLFILALFVFTFNYITSYMKSVKQTNVKKSSDVFKSYFSIGLLILPLMMIHNSFLELPNHQLTNFMIFAQNFSLKYIEEIYYNMIGRNPFYININFMWYLILGLLSKYLSKTSVSTLLGFTFVFSTFYYVRSILSVVSACKKALNINVIALNNKKLN